MPIAVALLVGIRTKEGSPMRIGAKAAELFAKAWRNLTSEALLSLLEHVAFAAAVAGLVAAVVYVIP